MYIRVCVYMYVYMHVYIYNFTIFETNTNYCVKREYRQHATIRMFIVKYRSLLQTTVSTCFVHNFAHHQENKVRLLLHMVFIL